MEAFKELLDSLRSSVYTILSLLLPGSIIVYLAQSLLPERFRLPPHVGRFLVAAYVAGLAAQGFGSVVAALARWSIKRVRKLCKSETCDAASTDQIEAFVKNIIDKNLDSSVPSCATLDIALSAVHEHREIYDRFTALRDMCRGLIVACAVAFAVLLARKSEFSASVFAGGIVVIVAAVAGFGDRYLRFSPLPRQIALSQFIAAQLKKPTADNAK